MESPPTPSVPGDFTGYQHILAGYRHQDFPDLSSRRFAPGTLRTISQALTLDADQSASKALAAVVVAVGRVLGAYCGCTDVLLAIADDEEEKLRPVRVTWDESSTWVNAVEGVSQALADANWPRVSPSALRSALDLAQKQLPCLALISAHPLRFPRLSAPLVVTVDRDNAVLSITASERSSHPSQSQLLASQVDALVAHAQANPQATMARLPQLPAALVSSYDTHSFEERCHLYAPIPPVKFAADHLLLRATERPDGIAVRWHADLSTDVPIDRYVADTITYVELNRKANQVAHWLRGAGIDAELPVERQQYIAKDSNARFILSSSDLSCFASLGDTAIDFTDASVQAAFDAQSVDAVEEPQLGDPSYILYTSGTTGAPKGCILTHRGLSEAIWALSAICASVEMEDPSDGNYLSIASVAFDVHLAEIFVPLAIGIPILTAPRSLLLEDLPYYITHLRVSHVGIVPSLIEATMGAVQEDEASGHSTNLRYIASGGEKMSDAILDKWASHPKIKLANFYGPSEVTIGCAARLMDKDTPRANIGHTFINVGGYVVDENMEIILRGGTGELVVEGPLVGLGYVGRPDLTEKAFLKFPNDGTERWAYRTGDLVRMMPDATLEIIGRIDTQIKLRGVRIESEGISSILRTAAAPKRSLDVMTILGKHPAIGADQLISFIAWDASVPVSARKGGKPSLTAPPEGLLQQLRSACDRELASYMRPSHIIPLSFIPLSSNGKADAKVLAAFFLSLDIETLTQLMSGGRSLGAAKQAERREPTEVERRVLDVLKPFVKLPPDALGPHTNIFECGLDSLAIARLAADVRRTFDVQLSPAQIMQHPAVSEIATLLERSLAAPALQNGASPIDEFARGLAEEVGGVYAPNAIESLLPPFPVQEGVLYRSVNSPSMYVQHVVLRLASGTSTSGLQDAWTKLVAEHEMLRTVFHFGSNLVQVVLRVGAAQSNIAHQDVQASNDADFQQYFTSKLASSIARELNLGISTVPPVRLSTFTASAESTTYLVISIHHALYDGISLPVLLRDLELAYSKTKQLPSAPLRAVLEPIVAIDQTAAHDFWTDYLEGFPSQRLLNKEASGHQADILSVTLKRPLSELQAKAASKHVTLQALLMSAYGYLLGQRLYGHDDVVFGVIRAGRSLPVSDIDTTICPMITVLPARVRYKDATTVLQSVQHDIARVGEFEHIPLSRIQKWVSESGASLFDTLFSVSFKENEESSLWNVVESQNPEPDYILAVEMVLDPEHDQAVAHAAFTSADISPALVHDILNRLEETAIRMSESDDWSLPVSNGNAPHTSSHSPLSNGDSEGDGLPPDVVVDEGILERIREIASQFLRIDAKLIAGETSLLSLGLDSIKSVGLSRQFSKEGFALSSADIMRLSTLSRLAVHVQGKASAPQDGERMVSSFKEERDKLVREMDMAAIRLSEDDEVSVFPTTTLQAGMLSQTVSSNGRLYVHLFPLRLSKDVDVVRLREVWQKAVATFDILRTTFHFLSSPGVWAQAVHSTSMLHWSETASEEGANLTETLNPYLKVTDEGEFFREPPVYFNLMKSTTPDAPDHLVLVLHHALYDGLSIANLLHWVEQLYLGIEIPSPARYHELLPALLWQEKNGTDFWVSRLRGLNAAPIQRELSGAESYTVHQLSLPVNIANDEVSQVCRSTEVTAQCLGQAAFAKLLAVMTRSPDVVFGRVISGRDVPGAEDVIGPMLNTVPCRVTFGSAMDNRSLLKEIHKSNIASMSWQHASLRSIQRKLGVSNLWDSIFVFQPKQESLESESNRVWAFDVNEAEDISVHYPLNIELHETEDGFVVQAACTSEVADAIGIANVVQRYITFLCDVVRLPDAPWSSGLPEIPVAPSNAQASQQPENGEVATEWEPRFDEFRNVLSVVTKVPASKIFTSTPLATLGIDSITAVQLVAKARRIGLRLSASDVVQSPSVGALLQKLKDAKAPAANGIKPVAVSVDVPREQWPALLASHDSTAVDLVEKITYASPGMEWMIGMWQRSAGSRFQHAFGYRLPADVDAAKLQTSWSELIRRHAVLRSTFVYDSAASAPRVVVFKADAMGSSWTTEALDSSADDQDAVARRMNELVSHPPSIACPTTRAVLLHSSSSAYLLVHLHHFQYDAWSLQLLVDDLARLYLGQDPRSSTDLEGFIRYTVATPSAEKEQETYWKSTFASADDAALFPDFPATPDAQERRADVDNAAPPENRARELAASLKSVFRACWSQVQSKHPAPDTETSPPALPTTPDTQARHVYTDGAAIDNAAALEQRARELAVSLQSVFLACWARVQSKHAGTDVATFSLWHSGRTGELQGVDRLAAPCINVLPYRVDAVAAVDGLALARRIQSDLQARSAIVEQSRLAKVHEWVGVPDKPLSNVFVNIIKVAPEVEKSDGALLQPVEVPYHIPQVSSEATAGIDKMRITDLVKDDVMIDIVVLEKTDKVAMSIEFAGSVLDSATAKSLLEEWASLVKAFLQ
ncbi:Nonribosomal peptide synthetase 2 [Trametes pubescens]|uniref:Nonribosomal peptide synthetase 2 n=1 Tax=Trametes pubescens TaxID=154538 RepID=A0A1M2V7L0_TRAPU|nr:Nonribosomal peptide synthetase 2 [Trametes pubescens]